MSVFWPGKLSVTFEPDNFVDGSFLLTAVLYIPVAPVAYQVILEPGTGQFREFEPRRVHIRINSLGLFLVHKLTCGKRESVS